MVRAVIVEDEPLGARFLESLLVATGKVEVVGIAKDAAWGLTVCSELAPDAVFLDVQMPGSDGFQLAAELGLLANPPLLVFATGHSARACEAFRLRAVDYLLKPLDSAQVCDAVCRLEALIYPSDNAKSLPSIGKPATEAQDNRLPVRGQEDDHIRLIPKLDIMAAICRCRRTWIHTATDRYATYYVLSELLDWLGSPPFVRISRESVVNLQAIEEVIHFGDRQYQVKLRDRSGTLVDASRSGAAHLANLVKPPI